MLRCMLVFTLREQEDHPESACLDRTGAARSRRQQPLADCSLNSFLHARLCSKLNVSLARLR